MCRLNPGGWIEQAGDEFSIDEIVKEMYIELVELDTRLGLTPSEQLLQCLHSTTRWDIIKI